MEQAAAIGDLGIEQWRIWWQWLFFKNIERGASNHFFFQGVRERYLVDHGASRTVYQVGGRFHQLKRILVDEMVSRFVSLPLA